MDTTVFLVRHGETDWQGAGRIIGAADIGLNAEGIGQAHALLRALECLEITEVLSSPSLRALQTAEVIAGATDIEVARDPRLADFDLSDATGKYHKDLAQDPEYRRFLADPVGEPLPTGERLGEVRDRAVASIGQALTDNAGGENVLIVTHANLIRVLLAHYLGTSLACYVRLRVVPGSLSILRFANDQELPRVLAINLPPGGLLGPLLR